MLLREEGDAVIAIGQASHAWLSGQLARAWAGDLPHREELCLAAEQHDVGMAQWDLAPDLDPATGRPVPFTGMSLETHLGLWSAAPERLFTQSRLAALLVSLHGTKLYERRDLSRLDAAGADAVRLYVAGQRVLQERLATETGASWDDLARLQGLLFLWDWMSLALCLDWAPAELGAHRLRRSPSADAHVVDPWPFAEDELVVRCEGRRLEGRSASVAELHAALERAGRVELRFALRRG